MEYNVTVKSQGSIFFFSDCKTNEISPLDKYCKYKNMSFEEMTVNQFHDMYNIHQKSIN